MSALDEPSTINAWIHKSGPIELRRAERKRDTRSLNLGVWLWPAIVLVIWALVFVEYRVLFH